MARQAAYGDVNYGGDGAQLPVVFTQVEAVRPAVKRSFVIAAEDVTPVRLLKQIELQRVALENADRIQDAIDADGRAVPPPPDDRDPFAEAQRAFALLQLQRLKLDEGVKRGDIKPDDARIVAVDAEIKVLVGQFPKLYGDVVAAAVAAEGLKA